MSMLVQWWHTDVMRRRVTANPPRPRSNLMVGVGVPLGTAHALSPSTRWMNWAKVYDRMLTLMNPRTP